MVSSINLADVGEIARTMEEAAPIAAEFTAIAAEWHNK